VTDQEEPRRASLGAERNPAAVYDGVQATVGRAAHYVAYGVPGKFPSVCRAATITEVTGDGDVGLCVENPGGVFFHPVAHENGPCRYSDEVKPGTWHWPERA
jgi:hypothetical protein